MESGAPLLLTILSILATWALLGTLVVALLLILKTLASVRGHLERIGFGVRAIEHELAPLGGYVPKAANIAGEAAAGVAAVADRLEGAAAAAGRVDLDGLDAGR